MRRLLRYEYNGHEILLPIHSSDRSGYISPSEIGIYVDGSNPDVNVKIGWKADKMEFLLPDGEHAILTIKNRPIKGAILALTVDGRQLTTTEKMLEKEPNLNNLKVAARLKPIANLDYLDFCAIKALHSGAVVEFPGKADKCAFKPSPAYFINNTGKTIDPESLKGQWNLPAPDFIRVRPEDIQPGDDVIIRKENLFGAADWFVINDVSNVIKHTYDINPLADLFLLHQPYGFIIEGANVTWTTIDLEEHRREMTRNAGELGIDLNEIAQLFPRDLTFAEFETIHALLSHDIQITDKILQEIGDGVPIEEIVERETINQPINTYELDELEIPTIALVDPAEITNPSLVDALDDMQRDL